MKKQNILATLVSMLLLTLTACLGAMNPADEVIGRWSVSSTSCVNPIDFKPLGKVTMSIPSAGSIDGNWSRSGGTISISKAVVGNSLLGVKVKVELTEPQNNQMTIKSASITGAGGLDLSNFLSSYNTLYKCK